MAGIEMVIFDCDGVLVDSEPIANEVFAAYLNQNGLAMSVEEVMETFVGLSLKTCAEMALNQHGVRLPNSFVPDIRRLTEIALRDTVEAVPFISETLDRLTCKTCVASSGEISKMTLTLGRTGLLDRLADRLYSATEVNSGKPAPDLFLHAAQQMGVDPVRCIVIEDSPYGVQGAVAAGMRALGYCGGGHRNLARDTPMLMDAGATAVFDDMRRLPELVGLG